MKGRPPSSSAPIDPSPPSSHPIHVWHSVWHHPIPVWHSVWPQATQARGGQRERGRGGSSSSSPRGIYRGSCTPSGPFSLHPLAFLSPPLRPHSPSNPRLNTNPRLKTTTPTRPPTIPLPLPLPLPIQVSPSHPPSRPHPRPRPRPTPYPQPLSIRDNHR